MAYLSLHADKLIETIERLERRIHERFPDAGLGGVCTELLGLARKAKGDSESVVRPNVPLRVATGALILVIVVGLGTTIYGLSTPSAEMTILEFISILEAGINDVVLIGLGVFFLASVEGRLKRRRVLSAIHELRSIAHIVDMHQLTKDPGHTLHDVEDTPSSPGRVLTSADLGRYLDYCSEMLSLTGKIAALYVQRFDDPIVLAAVNEVEGLATGMSSKIWQKLVILEGYATLAAGR